MISKYDIKYTQECEIYDENKSCDDILTEWDKVEQDLKKLASLPEPNVEFEKFMLPYTKIMNQLLHLQKSIKETEKDLNNKEKLSERSNLLIKKNQLEEKRDELDIPCVFILSNMTTEVLSAHN